MAKILIVEDFSDARNVLGLLLASYGHEIIEAQDGQQAVETALQQRPDLILMDMSMPVLSGWEATRRIKANPATADIPVIALTAHAMRGDRERAWEAGCDGFITKPIDDELLVHTIDQILSERQNAEPEKGIPPSDIALNEPGRAQEKVFTIHNGHVLIIDGGGEIAGQFEASLKEQGYRTSLAEGLESALASIESDSPDLIICGASFDGLSSYEIVKRIKQDEKLPFIPIILVTEDEAGLERGLEAGADDFIAQPADMTKLIARARSLIRLKMAVAAESSRADQLASVISQMFTGLLILDAEAKVSIVNGSGLEMLCLSLDDVMGVQIDELIARLRPVAPEGGAIDPEDFPLKRAIAKGESVSKQIICVSTRNCDKLYLRCNAAPIYDERGRKIGAATVFEDVTEEVNTQQQLDEQKQKLEAANAQLRQLDYLKSRFLSNVAHEMRTPLTAIGVLTELLDRRKDQLPLEAQDVISRLMNNSHHINNMINDLLDYSRLVAGKEAIKPKLFSPKEMIEEVRDSLIDVASQRGLKLRVELAEDLPAEVTSDPIKCRRVITELINNAIRYTDEGEICVTARSIRNGRFWSVEVKDTGVGISADELGNIFDEFHQAENREASRAGRTGLGLPISKRLIELMGGRIEVESNVGQGTLFKVVWPSDITPYLQINDAA